MIKKFTALLLILSFIFVAASCSQDTASADTGSAEPQNATSADESTETDEIAPPTLPDADYEGYKFNILCSSNPYYIDPYIDSNDLDGEPINDAVYKRNLEVEEKYNIEIGSIVPKSDSVAMAKKSIVAGDSDFDVYMESQFQLGAFVKSNYLADIKQIPYLTLDSGYWDKNASEQLQIRGKLYAAVSDISLMNLQGIMFLYFNQQLIVDFRLPDPYQLVADNTWTLEKLGSMVKAISTDLNGDGVMDYNDQYGMLSYLDSGGNSNFSHFYIGSGMRFTESDSDGNLVLSVDIDKTVSLAEKLSFLTDNQDYTLDFIKFGSQAGNGGFPHFFAYARYLFTQNRFLFVQAGTYATDEFRDMKSDYGIAPNPKFDESQSSYWHYVDSSNPIMTIPVTNNELERTGAILEDMAYLSNKYVLPAYYNITVKLKRFRDNKAADTLDLIKQTETYDIAGIFGIDVSAVLNRGFNKGTIASTYASELPKLEKQLDSLLN